MLDICSNADEETDGFGLLKISHYSNFSQSLHVFMSPAAPSEGKTRMERFCSQLKWHSRMRGTSVPRRRDSTREGLLWVWNIILRVTQGAMINNPDSRTYNIAWPGLMVAHRLKLGEMGQGREPERPLLGRTEKGTRFAPYVKKARTNCRFTGGNSAPAHGSSLQVGTHEARSYGLRKPQQFIVV